MNLLILLTHPDPSSFNHAIAERVASALRKAGHEVLLHDLYAEGFDPILPATEISRDAALPPDIQRHCEELAAADGIVIVHPNWWGQPPALLTGWIDRVIRPGVAYEFVSGDGGEGVPRGLLKARAALVFNTSNTEARREIEAFGDPLERIWRDCVFSLCGVPRFSRRMFRIICLSDAAQREAWLDEAEALALSVFGTERG
jgi:putative NADPH-quinone reductase